MCNAREETVQLELPISREAYEGLLRLQTLLGSPSLEDTIRRALKLYGIEPDEHGVFRKVSAQERDEDQDERDLRFFESE